MVGVSFVVGLGCINAVIIDAQRPGACDFAPRSGRVCVQRVTNPRIRRYHSGRRKMTMPDERLGARTARSCCIALVSERTESFDVSGETIACDAERIEVARLASKRDCLSFGISLVRPAPLDGAPCTLAACRSPRARSAARAHCDFRPLACCRRAATSCRPDSCWGLARRDAAQELRHVRPNFGPRADSQRGSLEPGSRMRTTRRSVRPIRTATPQPH